MPEYYSQGNSVLGSRPVPRSVEPSHPNTLLAGLILLLCCGLVALMAWLRPAGGNANLASSVVYVLAL
ncbi:MAG: hypothetical protein HUU35_10085, partial [Armatimonadetes bacterium]|nr:hypothetical protein [Armatimonadota bacterium]